MSDLTCPKCQSPMRSYERNGVTLDQCTGCRGLFLDRGELERLVDAEGSFYQQAAERERPREPERQRESGYREPTLKDFFSSTGSHGHHGGGHHKKKRKSFLEEMFD
ncbi:MAG: hypothetical protein AVDCRST_MAG85-3971 [uncultured Solirubrobacteraceae bacterium]|uniref:Transcription factor zinc-finger domain-containing protein n=1 Tax=uncultured Solirubrobacteraceae bacterium TaxID=1162706 RepID=A0A6J4TXS3_9ACTN|nr:MAG: hypothetical protein AVDCRST_MAG85-3971 [uncultured Solirubrobacteraceae bacterium]